MTNYTVIAENLKIPVGADEREALDKAKHIFRRAGILGALERVRIRRKSIDARHKDNILLVCSVSARAALDPGTAERLKGVRDLKLIADEPDELCFGSRPLEHRPVIVGFGPAGMFCALELARNGYAPLVLERGGDVASRAAAVERFMSGGEFSPRSNIQFGAGGAGTFSDGKLTTRIGDKYCGRVLDEFVRFGADESILWQAKPHIGTDVLRLIVSNIDSEVRRLGGTVEYGRCVDEISDGAIGVGGASIPFGALVLAIGHSSRDTYGFLMDHGYPVIPKPFSVGVRVEHLRESIDRAMYGDAAALGILPPAEYALSYRTGARGVYTFCMCPGGVVVPAASEEGGVVTNGMSYHARDGRNSNAALAVSVLPEDFGGSAIGAISFQRELEHKAFAAGGGNFAAPMQPVGKFLGGSGSVKDVVPTYMNGKVTETDLASVLPDFVSDMLMVGIRKFGEKISGFDAPDAVLTGVETRTSAPVRIMRGEDRRITFGGNIYPCGEGAGYAGGIMSAAVDGIRTARAIMAEFAPPKHISD